MKLQDLNRIRQIAVLAARHGFADVVERGGVWGLLGRKEKVEVNPEAQRASTARRFRILLGELGPTFIKLGQVLSTRADLLPAEFIRELSLLQDSVQPFPIEEVHAQIRDSLGQEVSALFAEIDPVPLAAASIGQVHRARTLDGDDVVIKVQRPGIVEQIKSDLSVLRSLARLLEAVIEETGIYTPTGIVEEFDRAIHEELDFLNEAANIGAFLKTHQGRDKIKIPRVYEALSSRQVLTLEFVAGAKLSALDLSTEQRHRLARNIIEVSFRQLFTDGLFHGDPHPGNLLVRDDEVLVLLDFGLVGRLTKSMQEALVMLALAVALKDADSVARLIYRLGVPEQHANLQAFRQDIDDMLNQHLPQTLGEVSAQNLVMDILDLAVKYKIRIPKEYAILSRAAVATEGILRSLAPELNLMEVMLPYAKELLAGRYDPSQLQGGMMRTLLRLQGMASEVPGQISQILIDLESGKFSVNVRSEQLERLTGSVRTATAIGFLGMCACGLIVGAFISFSQHPWIIRGLPVLGMLAVAAVAAIFGAATTWYFFGHRVRKVRIRRFLPRSR